MILRGVLVVRDGRLARIDEVEARAEIRAAFAEFAPRLAEIEAHAARLEPHYRTMYERALAQDVGMSRWVDRFPA